MRNLALVACVVLAQFATAATTKYETALAALRNVGASDVKQLDVLITQPVSPTLLADARAAAFLNDNQAVLELFRQAAEQNNDGYLFAPKAEKLNSKTPSPTYSDYLKLFKLLIIDAEFKTARKQPRLVEKNLLAAAGFLVQLSEQKSGALISTFVQWLCLRQAHPLLSESLRSRSASSAYLAEISIRLARVERNQDFLQAGFLEDSEITKGVYRESVNPMTAAAARETLPFFNRIAARRFQDSAYFSIVHGQFDAAVDVQTALQIGAVRANDPERVVAFFVKREKEFLARKQARDSRSEWFKFQDGLKGGMELKQMMADATVDTLIGIATPNYQKLIPPYHVFLCELNVLRTGLAAKLYQRAHKRPPDDLNQLVPAFLSEVPRDSFNGFAPLRYIRTGNKFTIYSLGPDGKDNEGSTMLDWVAYSNDPLRNVGDIVFSDQSKQ